VARVLLVDDDIAEISAVKRVLARAGHQPVLATNGSDALASVAQARPDLLVVSATCDGGDALSRVVGEDDARGLPLLVLGESPAAPADAAQLARPVDPAQLAAQVTAALATAARAAPAPEVAARAAPAPAGGPRRAAPGRSTAASRPIASVRPRAADRPASPPVVDGAAEVGGAARRGAAAAPRAPPARPASAPVADGSPSSGGAARRAAAAALLERAAELRRPAASAPPGDRPPERDEEALSLESIFGPTDEEDAALDAILGRADEEDPGLEAILRRAEEAERAHAAERKARARQADRATVEAAQRAEAERFVVEKTARARAAEEKARTEERARAAAEEKARAEERARAAAERKARAEQGARAAAEEKARTEERARAVAERKARAEEDARAVAERKARAEAAARARAEEEVRAGAEAERRAAAQEARRARAAEERAGAEADARRRLEEELERLRGQVETERKTAEEKIHRIMERAAAEEVAAEDLRRLAEEEAQRKRHAEEEELRTAISSARAEMEALRRRGEEEARRRAEAEAEVERLAREAERRAAEAAAVPAPFALPVYRPPADDPPPDPAEEAARRRVAALRDRAAPDAASLDPEHARRPARAGREDSPRPARAVPPELRAGTLEDLPAPRLLTLAALSEATGRLDLEGETARSIWLERGRVVGAASGDPADRVEEVALRLGLVTRDQHRQVAGAAVSLSPRRTALLLVERGFVKPTELTTLVRRRTEEVVFGAFSDPAARFRWAAAEIPDDERIALERSTLALAVEGVRRRWLAARVDAVLGGAGTLLAPLAAGPPVEDLGLSAQERRAVALADGLRTVDEIVAASPLDPLSTRQVLAALVLVGSLVVRVFQGGRPAAAAAEAIDLARVREKLEQARRADYFTVLGVSRLCTPHEVREAAARLTAEFDPRRYEEVREEGLEARLEEILDVIDDAREILADDGLRAEYLRGLGD
jgi:CheY-like chemotaxis protein